MADAPPQTTQPPAQPNQLVDVLISIDLLGEPDDTVFAALHGGMTAQKYLTTLTTDDGQLLALPGGTFTGQTEAAIFDLSQNIHDWIVAEIWQEGAIVLVNELATWSIAGND